MKRVLILIKGLGRGGAEQLLLSAAPHLARDRFEYQFAYLLSWKNALVRELEEMGMAGHCLDGARGPGWVGRLRSLARDRRIDLVHAHSPVAAIGARMAFGRRGPRIVYTEHNVWSRYHRVTYWGNLLTYSRNDHVFAVSDEVGRSIQYPRGLRFLRTPPVETLHHGIDHSAVPGWSKSDGVRQELAIPAEAPLIGTIANFKVHKGHRYLLQAMLAVRKAVPDVRCVLVGVGPTEREVRRQTDDLGLDGSIVFAGFREDAPRVAQALDVFVLPSEYEGLSIALLEAMALGKPVVATRVGGVPEVVTNTREGLLVPPRDPGTLADAIATLLSDGGLRARMGEAARKRAADFDIRKAVSRMEEVYEELLA